MKLLFLLLVTVACATTQVHSATNPEQVRDLIDDAKEALKKLDELIESILTEADNTIKSLQGDVDSIKQTVLDAAQGEVDAIANAMFAELDEWKAKAGAVGVDIIECTQGEEDKLRQLPVDTLNGITSCVTDQVNQALGILASIVEDIQNTYDEVKGLSDKLDGCGDGLGAIICITEVIEKIAEDTVELPSRISGKVDEAVALVKNLPDALVGCEKQRLDDLKNGGEAILNGMIDCIQNKILGG